MKIQIKLVNLMVILSLFIFYSCEQSENSKVVKISGQVINPMSDSVIFLSNQNFKSDVLAKAALDNEGRFNVEFSIEQPSLIVFGDKNEVCSFFVKPETKISLSVNTDMFDETMSFEGDLAAENNFMMKFYLAFEDFQSEKAVDFYSESQTMEVEAYRSLVENEIDKRRVYFEKEKTDYALDGDFKEFFSNRINLSKPSLDVYVFYGYRPRDTSESIVKVKKEIANEIIETKKQILKSYKEQGQSLVQNSIPTAVRYIVNNNGVDKNDFDSVYYDKLSNILSQDELNEYLFNKMKYSLEGFNKTPYESKTIIIDKYLADETLKNELAEMYLNLKMKLNEGYATGLNKYDFGTEENKDKLFVDILTPYKGNVIYLDLWASWCGPCKAELPFSHKLKERMKGKDVVFIYLSTDRDQKAWENMMIMMQLEGEHYRANKDIHKYLSTEYDLQYIPHYIIFDKEGNLVKNNAPRPSSEEIQGELEALL